MWLSYRNGKAGDILMKAKRANPTLDIMYTDQALLLIEENILALDGKDLQSHRLDIPQRSQELHPMTKTCSHVVLTCHSARRNIHSARKCYGRQAMTRRNWSRWFSSPNHG